MAFFLQIEINTLNLKTFLTIPSILDSTTRFWRWNFFNMLESLKICHRLRFWHKQIACYIRENASQSQRSHFFK